MSPSIAQRLLDVQSRLRRLDAALADLASKPIFYIQTGDAQK
jgi:hypothetical protein